MNFELLIVKTNSFVNFAKKSKIHIPPLLTHIQTIYV